MTTVVKVGGGVGGAAACVAGLRRRGTAVAVVHGAGPEISARCRAAGIEPRFLDGQRVTDPAVLAVVAAAIADENAGLVAGLRAAGIPAAPLDGVLAGIPAADRRLGLVGSVEHVDGAAVRAVIDAGRVPVIVPMASGLNVNADHAASAVASALGAAELVFLSTVPGVLDARGRVIARIRAGDAHALIAAGDVTGGMIPKLHAGVDALARGVWRVWIGAETMVTA